jgi:hypothetical protein
VFPLALMTQRSCTYVYEYRFICMNLYMYLCMYVYMYVYTYVCIHTHTRTYIHIHIHIYIYIYIYLGLHDVGGSLVEDELQLVVQVRVIVKDNQLIVDSIASKGVLSKSQQVSVPVHFLWKVAAERTVENLCLTHWLGLRRTGSNPHAHTRTRTHTHVRIGLLRMCA